MLRLLIDESVRGQIVRGLIQRRPQLDLVTARDAGLLSAADPRVLNWAAAENRIVVTEDRATMPNFAFERVLANSPMPGLFIVSQSVPVAQAIDEISLLDECTDQHEWNGKVIYLPL